MGSSRQEAVLLLSQLGSTNRAMIQPEWARVEAEACKLSPWLCGDIRYFVFEPFGEAICRGPTTLTRAKLWGSGMTEPVTVVVKLRSSDWNVAKHVEGSLKALQAVLMNESPEPVLDVSGEESVIVAAVNMVKGEQIQLAELFCGGFAGISQAAALLYSAGLPIHVAWRLDWDPLIQPYLETQDPSLRFVHNHAGLTDVETGQEFVVQGDAASVWWMSAFLHRPTNAIALSTPCPPWSGAGRARGLDSPEGRLLERMVAVCQVAGVRYVLLEQVENYPRHPHFRKVQGARSLSPYCCPLMSLACTLTLASFRVPVPAHVPNHQRPIESGMASTLQHVLWPVIQPSMSFPSPCFRRRG